MNGMIRKNSAVVKYTIIMMNGVAINFIRNVLGKKIRARYADGLNPIKEPTIVTNGGRIPSNITIRLRLKPKISRCPPISILNPMASANQIKKSDK